MIRRLRNAFVAGLLVLFPLLATVDILRWFIHTIDGTVRNYLPSAIFPAQYTGLGFIFAVVLVLSVGFLAQNFVGKATVSLFDSIIRRMPVVGGLYGTIKKFLETILSSNADQFHEAVLVQFPREGVYSIGFRTGKPDPKISGAAAKALVNVFVPCTPNPTSGFYLLVEEKELIPLAIPVQDAFKIVVSMGIVTSSSAESLKASLVGGAGDV